MCTAKNYIKKLKSVVPFYTELTCLQVLYHYCAINYFESYLNQIPKPLSQIEKYLKKTDNID